MLPDVWGALSGALSLVGDVLRQDAAVTQRLGAMDLFWSSIGVAPLALVSIGLGQSGVLFLNRIRGVGAVISGGLAMVFLIALRLLEALVTWGVAWLLTGRPQPVTTILTIFLLSLAPHIYSAFTFLPYVGLILARVLDVWSFLLVFLLLGSAYELSAWRALLITGSGWLLMQLLARLLSAPLSWISSRLWTLATGEPVLVTSANVLTGGPFVPVPTRKKPLEPGAAASGGAS